MRAHEISVGALGWAGAGSQEVRVQPPPKSIFCGVLLVCGLKLAFGAFSAGIGQCHPPGEPDVETFSSTHCKRQLANDKLKVLEVNTLHNVASKSIE